MHENNRTTKIPILAGGAVVLSAILLIGIYTLFLKKPSDSTVASTSTDASQTIVQSAETTQDPQIAQETTPTQTTEQASPSVPTNTYKDGVYTKTASYRVPEGGTNKLITTITVKNDEVVSVTSNAEYDERESSRYVNGFNSNINGTVSGKKLGNIHIGRVGGASLTSEAFNSIIDAVLTDAKA